VQSILFAKLLRKKMDPRVKPAGDARVGPGMTTRTTYDRPA
jgi:hypothetical protein